MFQTLILCYLHNFFWFALQNGYTPLHQAAQQGNTHVINVLLQHGAKPNATTMVTMEIPLYHRPLIFEKGVNKVKVWLPVLPPSFL